MASAALAKDNIDDALFWFRQVSNWQSEFTPTERLIGAQRIFVLGRDTDDADLRLEALTDMLHTGELQPSEQLAAARSAAAIAMKKGEDHFASLMLREVIQLDSTDAQSIANLAILQRKAGDPQASATMQQAHQRPRGRWSQCADGLARLRRIRIRITIGTSGTHALCLL